MKPLSKLTKVIFISVLLAILLFSIAVFARAGGGHSFGGSSSSGGFRGGGHSGGGGGGDILFLIMLIVRYPYIGIPVVIGGIAFFYFMGRGANNYRINSVIRKAGKLSDEQLKAANALNLAKIKEFDPNFSEERFLERAKDAFMIIQKAWSDQNLSLIRPFVSNGVYNRFSIQIEIQKAENRRNLIENINILNANIIAAASDNFYDRIDVAFSVMMDDKDIDLKTQKVLQVNESSFIEYWTFLRKRGTKTLRESGLIEGRCPNCGGEIKINENAVCEYCKAFVFSGEYDWILTEITQEEEYVYPDSELNIIGFEDMLKKDPEFNLAVIEDKVSYIFYRIFKTNYYGDIKYLKVVSHPDYYSKLINAFNPANEWYQSLSDAAVGSVETKKISVNGEDGYDRVEVMITWSAKYCERNRNTKQVRNLQEGLIRSQVYTLIRRSDLKTKRNFNFQTIPCRSCGAPLGNYVEDRCEYCGAVVNDGSRDWVLYSVDMFRPYAYQTQFSVGQNKNDQNRLMLSVMISSMLADGVIENKELEMIYTAAQNRGIAKGVIDSMIESAKKGLLLGNPSNKEEARGMLGAMARVALSDGKISSQEYNLLINFGKKYNYQKADIDLVINSQRKLLFQEAKDFIKNTKIG